MEFIRDNHGADNWFLQIDTVDPHEAFFSHQEFKNLSPIFFDESPPRLAFDWPSYKPLTESPSLHGGHVYCTDGPYVYMRAPGIGSVHINLG